MDELGTELGSCTKCRTRTAVTPCKLESLATAGHDPNPQTATLCAPCIDGLTTLRTTRLASAPTLTVV